MKLTGKNILKAMRIIKRACKGSKRVGSSAGLKGVIGTG
jgi:hypothetical protein